MNASYFSFSLAQGSHLRNDPSQFTREEWEALSCLTLPDPDPSLVQKVLKKRQFLSDDNKRNAGDSDDNFSSEPKLRVDQHQENHSKKENTKIGLGEDAGADDEKDKKRQESRSECSSANLPLFPKPPKQWKSHQVGPSSEVVTLRDFMSSTLSSSPNLHTSLDSAAALVLNNNAAEVGTPSAALESLPVSSGSVGEKSYSLLLLPSSRLADSMKESLSIIPKVNRTGDTDAIAETILDVHHVELIERGLLTTSPAEVFLNATHVFLQHNLIEELDGLQLLDNLQVLVVHHNKISSLQPLGILSRLAYVDASYNLVEHVNMDWDLPDTLQVLDLRHNLCCPETNPKSSEEERRRYREQTVLHFPSLVELNGRETNVESEDEMEEEKKLKEEKIEDNKERRDEELLKCLKDLTSPNIEKLNKGKAESTPVALKSLASVSSIPDDGLVTTPKKNAKNHSSNVPCQEGSKRLIPLSRQGAASRVPLSKDPLQQTGKQNTSKTKGDGQNKLRQLSDGGSSGFVEKRRKNVVEEVRAARGVKFDLPDSCGDEDKEEVLTEQGRNPTDDPLAYPTYDLRLLQSSNNGEDSTHNNNTESNNSHSVPGTTSLDAMLNQYLRRSAALIQVIRDGVMPTCQTVSAAGPHEEEEKLDENTDELRLARQVRNRARSDLDYASTVLGHHSRRSIEQLWFDVEKVLQTRSALVEFRRNRMGELATQHSTVYLESLALLKKEQHVKDLDKYREPNESTILVE